MYRPLTLVALLFVGLATGQQVERRGEAEAETARAKTQRADQQARDMRSKLFGRRAGAGHVKVRVRLKNGNRLTGVIKDGRLVERVDAQRFVPASADERGAGVRLYYSEGTRGFIFVPFARLASYRVLQRLAPGELGALERELQRVERPAPAAKPSAPGGVAAPEARAETLAAEAKRRRRLPPPPDGLDAWSAAPPEPQTAEAPPRPAAAGAAAEAPASTSAERGPVTADSGGAEAAAAQAVAAAKQEGVWSELLRRFPPAGGWNEAKKLEISRRFVVVGAKPSPTELEFVERFSEWLQACAHHGVAPNVGVAGAPASRGEARRAARMRSRDRRK